MTDLFSKRKQISIFFFFLILIFVPQSEVKPLSKLISVKGVSHNGIDCHNTKSVCQMNADKGMNVSNDNVGKHIQGHTLPAAAMSLSSHSHVEGVKL